MQLVSTEAAACPGCSHGKSYPGRSPSSARELVPWPGPTGPPDLPSRSGPPCAHWHSLCARPCEDGLQCERPASCGSVCACVPHVLVSPAAPPCDSGRPPPVGRGRSPAALGHSPVSPSVAMAVCGLEGFRCKGRGSRKARERRGTLSRGASVRAELPQPLARCVLLGVGAGAARWPRWQPARARARACASLQPCARVSADVAL